jgi:hypothetical protein
MGIELEELNKRIDKLERQKSQEILTLVEILSNATFFGSIKKTFCEHAKNGQCSYYLVNNEIKNKIPITANCRIRDCLITTAHHHIELSDITCTFCQKLHRTQNSS